MSLSRLGVVAIALSLAVVAVVVFREREAQVSPETSAAASRSAGDPRTGTDIAPAHDTQARAAQETNRGARPMPADANAPKRPAARPRADDNTRSDDSTKEAVIVGSIITAAEHDAAARRRDEVVRNMPEPREQNVGAPDADEDAVLAGFPAGTRFAAKLDATTRAVDGSEPLVEKNTNHVGDDGIYFPPDAQLAYPKRAGVQGDAGTVALWVEPVDWKGDDASVHSFFRLNDPSDGSYRFHLLKDSANLRFQFITEQGESNVRVPIDWWPRGEGHHVAATWDDNVLRLYVDGVALSEQPYQGTLQVPVNVPGWWGSVAQAGTPGAGAVLRETLVSDRPLGEAEIQGLWQEH